MSFYELIRHQRCRLGRAIDISAGNCAATGRIDLIPGDSRRWPPRDSRALLLSLGDNTEIAIESALVQVDVERHQSLRLRQRARCECFLHFHPQIARGRAWRREELTRSFAPCDHGRWIARRRHPDTHVNRRSGHIQYHRRPAVIANLVGAHHVPPPAWRAQRGVAALVAEIAKAARTMVVDERDIGADDGFAVGQLDDFNENFLGGEPGPDNDKCRSNKEWPQMHEFSDSSRRCRDGPDGPARST